MRPRRSRSDVERSRSRECCSRDRHRILGAGGRRVVHPRAAGTPPVVKPTGTSFVRAAGLAAFALVALAAAPSCGSAFLDGLSGGKRDSGTVDPPPAIQCPGPSAIAPLRPDGGDIVSPTDLKLIF